MMEPLYKLLAAIGYLHPIHPPITHLPLGIVIGAFLLGVISFLVHSQMAGRAARYCMIIALVSLFPTALLGYADWQRFYAGGWLRPIQIKMLLAGVLLVLTILSLIVGRGNEKTSLRLAGVYTLSLLTVLGLGFFGGEIVYSGRVPQAPPEFRNGQELFRSNCSGCHPYGTNIVDPKAELRGSDDTANAKTFIRWIRDPKLDNGARGVMPPFTPSRISDAQAEELLGYIVKVMGPAKPQPACNIAIPRIAVQTDPATIKKGNALFERNCNGCHTVTGTETVVGPGLKGILKRKTLPFGDWPATPENIFKQLRCPFKDMPSFKEKLTDEQVFDLIAFLNTQ